MTTTKLPATTHNVTQPWKFLGSASSVSPVSLFKDDFTTTTARPQDLYNGTGYYIDDDGDSVWSDFKTVVLACIATLVPLVIILIAIFGIRVLWMQYKTRKKDQELDGNVMKGNLGESPGKPLHTHLLNDKSTDRTHIEISTETVEICEGPPTSNSNRSSNVNGSIITMTLKNNHLIVETEERNDLEEDSRETTVRYSPSARDGVFVVEVQQGMRRSPGSGGPSSIVEPEKSGSLSDECALVHNPPERYSDEETLDDYDDSEDFVASPRPLSDQKAKTGLSSSTTSLGSLQKTYCYGSQHSYDQGSYGYNVYLGYENDSTALGRVKEDTKPKITSALYKTNPTRPVKTMSVDVTSGNERLKERLLLGQNSSLDNVVETNGLEEFSSNWYKTKLLPEMNSDESGSEFTVDNGVREPVDE